MHNSRSVHEFVRTLVVQEIASVCPSQKSERHRVPRASRNSGLSQIETRVSVHPSQNREHVTNQSVFMILSETTSHYWIFQGQTSHYSDLISPYLRDLLDKPHITVTRSRKNLFGATTDLSCEAHLAGEPPRSLFAPGQCKILGIGCLETNFFSYPIIH